ncbi:DgyrCDS14109 [Dimorphilus gyrociliatus]|uniref:DgyrCDS14109 n=1 Tax=Dimorphilus gyrociliatus TaxID=2664684 RepID=A0A7I8WCL8_9ANNE|nr:DgyrCDS14109 [Dimorphilus gyrociliatus]
MYYKVGLISVAIAVLMNGCVAMEAAGIVGMEIDSAILPPKKQRSYNETTIQRSRSSLEQMLSMGFSKQRAQKALAATGDKGVQLASDWLLSHVHDPLLDDDSPREYIVYLCPVGELQKQLLDMWRKSKQCGWMASHNYFPHVTLCSFFKAENHQVAKLHAALRVSAESLNKDVTEIKLDYFSSCNFIGLFIDDKAIDGLVQVMSQFEKKAASFGVQIRKKKDLHLSLAYQFMPEKIERLEYLARSIELDAPCRWDIRLYSRDSRIAHCSQLRRVIHPHFPRENDELQLIEGDFLSLQADKAVDDNLDEWYEGTSWLTGCSGLFPGNFTEKTAASETWTMHRSYPIIGSSGEWKRVDDQQDIANWDETSSLYERVKRSTLSLNEPTERIPSPHLLKPVDGKAAVFNNFEPLPLKTSSQGPRQLYIVRHGERIDFTFGKEWIDVSFDASGNYIRHDLNMPRSLPKRAPQDFQHDAPLTIQGTFQSRILGEALKDMSISIDHVYVSPSLRCVQTAACLLEALNLEDKLLNIEPALFEYMGWYPSTSPVWMNSNELRKAGYKANLEYVPAKIKLNTNETIDTFYKRSYSIIKKILSETEDKGGNVLVVAHAPSLDSCTRQLVGRPPRTQSEMHEVLTKIPYCSVAVCQQDLNIVDKWQLIEPPIMTFAHTSNPKYVWKALTN